MKILQNLNRTTRYNRFPNSKRLTNNLIGSAWNQNHKENSTKVHKLFDRFNKHLLIYVVSLSISSNT